MPVPAYGDIAKSASTLLSGAKDAGVFQFDPKVTYSGATSAGVTFTLSGVQKGDKVDASLKAAYSAKRYTAEAEYQPSGKINVTGSLLGLAPGLKLTSAVVLPDPNSAKLTVEYSMPYLNAKSSIGLTNAPVVDLTASTGYKNVILGAETAYDTAKSVLTKYNAGVGYHAADFQVGAFLQDKGNTVKLAYCHSINPKSSVGAEIVRKLASGDTNFTLGYQRALESGSTAKFKVDNAGLLSALYETKLASGEKVAAAVQLQATDLSKAPKYGFALTLA